MLLGLSLHFALDAKCKLKGLEVGLVEVFYHWFGQMEQLRAVFIDFIEFLKNISVTAQKITLNS
jgi:hypothetical protein